MWTHGKELHAKLPGISKDFGPILAGAVWDYHPDHELRHGDFLEDHSADPTHGSMRPSQHVMDGVNNIRWIDQLTGGTDFKRSPVIPPPLKRIK